MNKIFHILLLVSVTWFVPAMLQAQTHDVGAIASMSLSKDFGLLDAKLEQEFRVDHNLNLFDRSLTSLGLSYTIIPKLLKAQADYDFIYRREKEYFEFRHRSSAALEASVTYNSFEFEYRTRGQAVWRDESRGDYKFNPRYIWRNKLECNYKIFGSPARPYASAEVFTPINSTHGFYLDGYRFTVGLKYRVSKRTTMQFHLRYDQEVQQADPKSILYGGVGWNYKL